MNKRERIETYLAKENWYTAIDCLLDYCEGLEHRIEKLEKDNWDRENAIQESVNLCAREDQ